MKKQSEIEAEITSLKSSIAGLNKVMSESSCDIQFSINTKLIGNQIQRLMALMWALED